MIPRLTSLIREGRYAEAEATIRQLLASGPVTADLEVTAAELLERLGKPREAYREAHRLLGRKDLPAELQSRCLTLIGTVTLELGQLSESVSSLQASVAAAKRANSLEQLCWAELRLLIALFETSPADPTATVFTDLRKHVSQLGDPLVSAALHVFVSEVEAKRGALATAARHLRVARSLLERHENVWLDGMSAIAEFCVAYMAADVETASQLARHALNSVERTGHARTKLAAVVNLGHIELKRGDFRRAEAHLRDAWRMCEISPRCREYVLEGFAQLALATDGPEKSDDFLARLDALPSPATSYAKLWSYPTRFRSFGRQHRWKDALDIAAQGLELAAQTGGDKSLVQNLHLLRAEAQAVLGDLAGAAEDVLRAAGGNDEPPLEGLAEFHRVLGRALAREGDAAGASASFERSGRILGAIGHLRARREVEQEAAADLAASPAITPSLSPALPVPAVGVTAVHEGIRADLLLRRAAAAIEQAARPDLLGPELLALVLEAGCGSAAALVSCDAAGSLRLEDTRGWAPAQALAAAAAPDPPALVLGTWREREWRLLADVPRTVAARSAWLAVHSLGTSGLALAAARRDAREREALWPIENPDQPLPGLFASEQMARLLRTARKVAASPLTVLITGETGVGKEVLARVIHEASRSGKPFVPFNCAAVPRDMLENQLFGHRRGAYTGADAASPGVIRSAAGGTVFLDEIGEVGLDLQPKLLRLLDSSEVHPLGEPAPVRVDVRIIAATNQDLWALVRENRFRADLLHRLAVLQLHVPPLRERREEIPQLVWHFLESAAREHKKTRLRVSDEALEYLVLYNWPGNVRELLHEVQRMAFTVEDEGVVMPEHLSPSIVASRVTRPASEREIPPNETVVRLDQPLPAATEHLERTMIQYAIKTVRGGVEQVAQALGLSRKGFYLKRQRLGIKMPGD